MAAGGPIQIDPDYEINRTKRLGKGGFGTVYEGFCISKQIVTAIKELEPSAFGTFSQSEIVPLKKELKHSSIIKFFKFIPGKDTKAKWYIAMELCKENLYDYLCRQTYTTLPYATQEDFKIQMIRGLEYLHSRQPRIVHRDIKLDNILLTEQQVVKLADFGLCKLLEMGNNSYMQSRKGNANWWAPEIWHGSQDYKIDVDIWSLGKVYLTLGAELVKKDQICFSACGKFSEHHSVNLYGHALTSTSRDLVKDMMNHNPARRPNAQRVRERLTTPDDEPSTRFTSTNPETISGSYPSSRNVEYPKVLVSAGILMGDSIEPNEQSWSLTCGGVWNDTSLQFHTYVPGICPLTQALLCVGGFHSQVMVKDTIKHELCLLQKRKLDDHLSLRRHFRMILFCGFVYAIGGLDSKGQGVCRNEKLSLETERWEPCADLPFATAWPILVSAGGILYVIENTCQVNVNLAQQNKGNALMKNYNPQSNTWTPQPSVPEGISTSGASAEYLNGYIYLVGGDDGIGLRFSLDDEIWEDIPKPSHAHSFGDSVVHRTKIIILGGKGSDGNIEEYDTKLKKWKVWDIKMPASLRYHTAMLLPN